MARYTGPKCRLCRREGVKLFLKGARCESEKCALSRRQQAPGQHGNVRKRRRGGSNGYELQLREKQKAKRIYGILEKQFAGYVKKALSMKEVTSESLMQTLEARLDSVVYRVGFAASRAQARQFIRFGYFAVNGRAVTTPSYLVKASDIVSILKPEHVSLREGVAIPEWFAFDTAKKTVVITSIPTLSQLEAIRSEVNPQLIVEYYSR